MILSFDGDKLRIDWEWFEQLFAFNLDKSFEIPLIHIERVRTNEPPSSWTEIRVPGTYLPGVIKAGTYYTNRGKEFWYVVKDRNYLVLELKDESFKKVILTLEKNETWCDQINQRLSQIDH